MPHSHPSKHTHYRTHLYVVVCAIFFIGTALSVYGAGPDFTYGISLFGSVGSLLRTLMPIFIALAFLVFVWGLVLFIAQSGDEKKIEEGRKKMIWGVLALFVITAIWGIMALLQGMVGADGDINSLGPPEIPR